MLDKQEQPVSVDKKQKIQQPLIYVPEEIKREHATVCPKNAKRGQIEKQYTIDEVKVMFQQGFEEMVGNLKEKLQAKQKEL